MTNSIPRRNVTFTDTLMASKTGERITVRRCYEDGKPTVRKVFVNGWCAREYKTDAGLTHYLRVSGARRPTDAQRAAWEQLSTP